MKIVAEMSRLEASAGKPPENKHPEDFNKSNTQYIDAFESAVVENRADAWQPNLYTDHALPCIIVAIHDGIHYGLAHFTAGENKTAIRDFLDNFDSKTAKVDIISGEHLDVKQFVDIVRSEHMQIRYMLTDSSRGTDVSDAYLLKPDGTGLYGEVKELRNSKYYE